MTPAYGDTLDLFPTLEMDAARTAFKAALEAGTHCEVCGRWAHLDGRLLNRTMVRALVWMWHLSKEGEVWLDVPEELRADRRTYDFSKQYSTVRHWGFLAQGGRQPGSKNKESGMWRPTPNAGRFLRGEIRAAKRIWTFDGKARRVSEETVHVTEIVGGFDYQEMMRHPWGSA